MNRKGLNLQGECSPTTNPREPRRYRCYRRDLFRLSWPEPSRGAVKHRANVYEPQGVDHPHSWISLHVVNVVVVRFSAEACRVVNQADIHRIPDPTGLISV